MSASSVDNPYRPLRSFSGSIQNEHIMASNSYHTGAPSSYHNSVTDDDLEEARQKLLANQYEPDPEPDDISSAILPTTTYQGGLLMRNGTPSPAVIIEPPSDGTNDNHSRTSRYGSMSYNSHRKPPRVKRYRLPLLILLGFDWGLVVFLSIICFVLLKVQYKEENENVYYWDLVMDRGFFDLVIIATTRTVFNILAYTLLGWVTRIVMAFTTVVSACYVPIKTYYLLRDQVNVDYTVYLIALLMLVFVSFVIPWLVAFFFEFKYLPAEKARLNIPSWLSIKPWVWPRAYVINELDGDSSLTIPGHSTTLPTSHLPTHLSHPRGMSGSSVSLDFRTPMGSTRVSPVRGIADRFGDDDLPPINEEPAFFSEGASPEYDQNLTEEDRMIVREGSIALEGLIELTRNNDGWSLDKTSNGIKCYSKQVDRQKILKLDGFVEVSARYLWSILYPGDLTPEWNTQCGVNETIHRVDVVHHVVYTTSNAMGPISSRDFVSARKIAHRDGAYYSSSKSIITSLKPEQSGKVRGENGPNGFVVIPINPTRCQLIWVYNCNLKGWLPKAVVDQTVSTALLGAYEQLQIYARERRPHRNQS